MTSGTATELLRPFAVDPVLASPNPLSGTASPFILTVRGPGGVFILAQKHLYHLLSVDAGAEILRTYERDSLTPELPSQRDVARFERALDISGAAASKLPKGMLDEIQKRFREQPKPHLSDAVVDESGRLWVITTRGTDETEVDVFGPAGDFLGTVVMKDRVKAISIRNDHIAALVRRETQGDQDGIDFYLITES